MAHPLDKKNLLAAAQAAEIAAAADTPEKEMAAMAGVFAHLETIQMTMANQHINRIAPTHKDQERLPLRADGDDFGRVVARVPKELYWHLHKQRNFGWDGFCDEGGMKDFLKAFPQCRVKTISGKTTVGWRGTQSRERKPYARFAPGVLNLAA